VPFACLLSVEFQLEKFIKSRFTCQEFLKEAEENYSKGQVARQLQPVARRGMQHPMLQSWLKLIFAGVRDGLHP
jgi:hypothetical protein